MRHRTSISGVSPVRARRGGGGGYAGCTNPARTGANRREPAQDGLTGTILPCTGFPACLGCGRYADHRMTLDCSIRKGHWQRPVGCAYSPPLTMARTTAIAPRIVSAGSQCLPYPLCKNRGQEWLLVLRPVLPRQSGARPERLSRVQMGLPTTTTAAEGACSWSRRNSSNRIAASVALVRITL